MDHLPTSSADLAHNLAIIRGAIRSACERCGRSADGVSIVAVTKGQPFEMVRKARAAGLVEFGENRVQEAVEKYGNLKTADPDSGLLLHMIGHLQRNKVRKAAQIFDSVDSVDSEELARMLDSESGRVGRTLRILLEVNTSNEPQKSGNHPDRTLQLVEDISRLPNLRLSGLMTIGPNVSDVSAIRDSFRRLRGLFDAVAERFRPEFWSVLSMGMTGDFEVAIEEGATEIRLGTALFGQRRNA
jgi:pyridoxal phosphate enzyme (YggS family)